MTSTVPVFEAGPGLEILKEYLFFFFCDKNWKKKLRKFVGKNEEFVRFLVREDYTMKNPSFLIYVKVHFLASNIQNSSYLWTAANSPARINVHVVFHIISISPPPPDHSVSDFK